MGRNNHNAGMHFQKHSKANYDDLAYYDKNSVEGINNRRYAALSALEEMGIFQFASPIGSIKVDVQNGTMHNIITYRVYSYKKEDERQLMQVTSKYKLFEVDVNTEDKQTVRIHDTQRIIYILDTLYNKQFETNKIYRLKSIYKSL